MVPSLRVLLHDIRIGQKNTVWGFALRSQENQSMIVSWGITQALRDIAREASKHGRGQGRGPPITGRTLLFALRDAGEVSIEDTFRVFDCRLPRDPGEQKQNHFHCGSWPDTLAGCMDQVTPEVLRKFAEVYLDALEEALISDARIVIVFYCKAGHHRSVALATIMQHVFEASGLPRSEIRNTCETLWWKSCGTSCQDLFFSYNIQQKIQACSNPFQASSRPVLSLFRHLRAHPEPITSPTASLLEQLRDLRKACALEKLEV